MTFSEAVSKLGIYFALEVFRQSGMYNAIPFSEWLKVAETAFTFEKKEERGLLFPRIHDYERDVARLVLKQVQAKATTFEDHHAILNKGFIYDAHHCHMNPDPWPVEVLKLCELAGTFDQSVIAYGYLTQTPSLFGENLNRGFFEAYRIQRSVMLERATNHAKTFEQWRWVASKQHNEHARTQAIEKMQILAVSLDEWLEFAKVVIPDGMHAQTYVEHATQKIVELTKDSVSV